jgi:site-specific DNA recombinase
MERPIAIYSRKSKFTGKGESIGSQRKLCQEYLAAHWGQEAAQTALFFEDEGFSGGNLNRPAFQSMMEAARQKKLRGIVVYRLDRISRNISDFSQLIQELSQLDVFFLSIREQFDTSTPMGRAMMYIASVFSQLERETIAERIRDNLHELAKTGRWLGGVPPTGYQAQSIQTITLDGKTKRSCKLVPLPEESALVRQIYALFLSTGSLAATQQALQRQGATTKNGKPFTRYALRALLQNPVYLTADAAAYDYFSSRQAEVSSPPSSFDGTRGILAYHRTLQRKGASTQALPISQWIIAVGQHPGLIPSCQWIEAQKLLEKNKAKTFHTPRGNQALLTGLLYCRCGAPMYPKLSKGNISQGHRRFFYVCKAKSRSRSCQLPNLDGNRLDDLVIGGLTQLSPLTSTLKDILKNYQENQCAGSLLQRKKELEETLQANEQKIAALVDALSQTTEPSAQYHITQGIGKLHQSSRQLKEQLQKLSSRPPTFLPHGEALLSLSFCLERLSVEERRRWLGQLIQKVEWDGATAHVFFLGALPKTPWGEDSK